MGRADIGPLMRIEDAPCFGCGQNLVRVEKRRRYESRIDEGFEPGDDPRRHHWHAWTSLLMTNFLSMLARNRASLGPASLAMRILYIAL